LTAGPTLTGWPVCRPLVRAVAVYARWGGRTVYPSLVRSAIAASSSIALCESFRSGGGRYLLERDRYLGPVE
jgi:hypothetical protein